MRLPAANTADHAGVEYPPKHELTMGRLNLLTALALALVGLNLFTLAWVWRLDRQFSVPIHVGSPNVYVTRSTLAGVEWDLPPDLLPELLPGGALGVQVRFNLVEKLPGSKLAVLYRTAGDNEAGIREAAASEAGPLEYEATIAVSPGETVQYRGAEYYQGELVRLTDWLRFESGEAMAGQVYMDVGEAGGGMTRLWFSHAGSAGTASPGPYGVNEIVVVAEHGKGTSQTTVLSTGEDTVDVNPQGLTAVRITVKYRDGLEKTVTLTPPLADRAGTVVKREQ